MRPGIRALKLTLFSLLTVSLVALVTLAAATSYFFNAQYTLSKRYYDLKVLSQEILFYDEVLTMSTMVSVHTKDESWHKRYQHNARLLDTALARAMDLDPLISVSIQQTADANTMLVDYEKRAFALVASEKLQEAQALLTSVEYKAAKRRFLEGITEAVSRVLAETENALDTSQANRGTYLLIGTFVSFVVVIGLWIYLVRYIRVTDRIMEDLVLEDDLTGLGNRRRFNEAFAKEIRRAYREDAFIMLAILDIDHFKRYNDTYGHPRGDEVMCDVSGLLKAANRRSTEAAFRIGGEEFAVISTCEDKHAAVQQMERVVEQVSELRIPHAHNPPYDRVTVSCGIMFASYKDNMSADELYHFADEALYLAKEQGRNRAVVHAKNA